MDVEWLSFAALYAIDEDCVAYWPTGEFGMPTFKGGGK
jgi:hypothetical protein